MPIADLLVLVERRSCLHGVRAPSRSQIAHGDATEPDAVVPTSLHGKCGRQLDALKAEESSKPGPPRKSGARRDRRAGPTARRHANASRPAAPAVRLPPASPAAEAATRQARERASVGGLEHRFDRSRSFRGGQAGRHLQHGASPGARCPFFLVPKFAGGFSQNTIDINARQSLLGVVFTGPKIGNFQSGGRISAVFFDNTSPGRP